MQISTHGIIDWTLNRFLPRTGSVAPEPRKGAPLPGHHALPRGERDAATVSPPSIHPGLVLARHVRSGAASRRVGQAAARGHAAVAHAGPHRGHGPRGEITISTAPTAFVVALK